MLDREPVKQLITTVQSLKVTPFAGNFQYMFEFVELNGTSAEEDSDLNLIYKLHRLVRDVIDSKRYKPNNKAEHAAQAKLLNVYQDLVTAYTDYENDFALQIIMLHRYFISKLAVQLHSHNILTAKKLGAASSIIYTAMSRLQKTQAFGAHACHNTYECSECETIFNEQIEFHISVHDVECARMGISNGGRLHELYKGIRHNTLSTDTMPAGTDVLGGYSPHTIQNQLGAPHQLNKDYSRLQKRWIHQLQNKKNNMEYYEKWLKSNPYKHARRKATKSALKWALAALALAAVGTVIIAAATSGVGSFVAIESAAQIMQSSLMQYLLGIASTGVVTGLLSYRYNKTMFSFKNNYLNQSLEKESGLDESYDHLMPAAKALT